MGIFYYLTLPNKVKFTKSQIRLLVWNNLRIPYRALMKIWYLHYQPATMPEFTMIAVYKSARKK